MSSTRVLVCFLLATGCYRSHERPLPVDAGVPVDAPVPRCGDGVVDPGEECDGDASCGPDCRLVICGRGAPDGLACDDGDRCTREDRCTDGVCAGTWTPREAAFLSEMPTYGIDALVGSDLLLGFGHQPAGLRV